MIVKVDEMAAAESAEVSELNKLSDSLKALQANGMPTPEPSPVPVPPEAGTQVAKIQLVSEAGAVVATFVPEKVEPSTEPAPEE